MAILVLWSSPDEQGLTAAVKNNLRKGIESAGGEVEEVHLNKRKIKNCTACGADGYGSCRTSGKCTLRDDFSDIYQAMVRADALVIVTPVYWHDIAENLKALFDRVRRCETAHNSYLQGKHCLIAACAGGSGRGVCECLVHLEATLGHMKMKTVERICVERFNSTYMLPATCAAGKKFAAEFQTN